MKKLHFVFVWVFLLLCVGMESRGSAIASEPDSVEIKIDTYLRDFRALPKKERKARIREAKRLWKQQLADSKNSGDEEIVFLAIVAILLPPLAVVLKENKVTKRFWICLLLSLLFLLPGMVYALLIVFGVI